MLERGSQVLGLGSTAARLRCGAERNESNLTPSCLPGEPVYKFDDDSHGMPRAR